MSGIEGKGNMEDDKHNDHNVDSVPKDEAEVIKKKYGGIVPKKPPLISKDHERAYFDSADWALGKQGVPVQQKAEAPEALRPKLQPTQHQQVRPRRFAPEDDRGDTTPEEHGT